MPYDYRPGSYDYRYGCRLKKRCKKILTREQKKVKRKMAARSRGINRAA